MRGEGETAVQVEKIKFGLGRTDLFPRIVPWVESEMSLGCLGWAEGPGVSKPSSRLGGAVNKGGSAAASDGAHLVVSRKRSCFRFGFGLRKTRRPSVLWQPSFCCLESTYACRVHFEWDCPWSTHHQRTFLLSPISRPLCSRVCFSLNIVTPEVHTFF